VIGSTGSLTAGAGVTAPFVDGVLSAHTVVFDATGQVLLTVGDPIGPSVSSAPIDVLPLTYENWRSYYFGDLVDPTGDPDANPDQDERTNKWEFVTLGDPLVPSGGIFNTQKTPTGFAVSLDFNRFQQEYRVRFQTSTNLELWTDSSIGPTVRDSLPERDIIEALFPNAEFNNQPFGSVRAVLQPIQPVAP
jgi:hypothetical protein